MALKLSKLNNEPNAVHTIENMICSRIIPTYNTEKKTTFQPKQHMIRGTDSDI